MNFNIELFKLVNGLAYKSILLDNIMIVLTQYIPYTFIAVLLWLFIYGAVKRKEEIRGVAVDTFVVTVINLILSFLIGTVYYIPRPFVSGKVNLLIPHVADASFPSDHAIGTMSIALGIKKKNKIYGIIMIMVSFMVGISRVYVGHHYPMDVIAGYMIVLTINYLYGMIVKDRVKNIYLKAEGMFLGWKPVADIIGRRNYDV